MPSLKAIRKRITSVKNTQKITKAMKMVAAAKLRRAQDAVNALRPYAGRMKKVAADLSQQVSDLDSEGPDTEAAPAEGEGQGAEGTGPRRLSPALLLQGNREERLRVVVVTSDRGLAGAFNSNVSRRTERFLVEHPGAQIELDVIGKKGRDALRRRKVKIKSELPGAESGTAARIAAELASRLAIAVESGEVDAVYVIYNEFKSAATQVVC